MSNLQVIRNLAREILDLSTKSAILADKRSIQFCEQYLSLRPTVTNLSELFKSLSNDHGIKTERLASNVFIEKKLFFI